MLKVRIDHRTGSVRFGTDLSESQRTDLPEGPHVQSMPSEQIRTQLMRMMVSLDGAINTIHPDRYSKRMINQFSFYLLFCVKTFRGVYMSEGLFVG